MPAIIEGKQLRGVGNLYGARRSWGGNRRGPKVSHYHDRHLTRVRWNSGVEVRFSGKSREKEISKVGRHL